jgi:hypothetical protein
MKGGGGCRFDAALLKMCREGLDAKLDRIKTGWPRTSGCGDDASMFYKYLQNRILARRRIHTFTRGLQTRFPWPHR